MQRHCIVVDYDTERFPFQAVLAKQVFGVERIDQLHLAWQGGAEGAGPGYADNLRLREKMQRLPDGSLFYKIYHGWVARVLTPHYGKVSYSGHPKMRVHLSGTGSVSDFHRDEDVTGRADQINCYLPFTDVYDGCTLWAETDYGNDDYQPLNLNYGQALLWDGGRLRHGTYANHTPTTRVSCDFRFSVRTDTPVQSPWRDVLAGRSSVPVATSP